METTAPAGENGSARVEVAGKIQTRYPERPMRTTLTRDRSSRTPQTGGS